MSTRTEGAIERGRAALTACEWAVARSCFEAALGSGESAAALDGLGQALYWQGAYGRAFPLRERAYLAYLDEGDPRSAGGVAVQLAALQLWVYGNEPACSGWLGHARRALADAGDCVELGWFELVLVSLAGSPEERRRHAWAAVDIARRFRSPELEFDALSHVGAALVELGEVADGMRLIDEALAAVSCGQVDDPWAVAEIYCALFGACELALDVRRADAWLAAVDGYVQRTGELPVSAICRTHYGALLTSAGRWDAADQELNRAIHLYDRSWRSARSEPVLRLADLRARQGRPGDARQLLSGHEARPEATAPLARLHLAAGEPALATATLERHLARRGRGVASVALLGLLVEARLAEGRYDAAAEVARELAALAAATDQRSVEGVAALAMARVVRAGGGTGPVTQHLEAAIAAFEETELRHDLAVARLLLARELSSDRREVAAAEARAALAGFEGLGAADGAREAREVLDAITGGADDGRADALTPREAQVLALLAEGRSNARIAAELHISLRTAEDHVSNILRKLGVHNRTEAAAHALRSARPDR